MNNKDFTMGLGPCTPRQLQWHLDREIHGIQKCKCDKPAIWDGSRYIPPCLPRCGLSSQPWQQPTNKELSELINSNKEYLYLGGLGGWSQLVHWNCRLKFTVATQAAISGLKKGNRLCPNCHGCAAASPDRPGLWHFLSSTIDVRKLLRGASGVAAPHSLDFYIPSVGVAITYNELEWNDSMHAHSNYHQDKTLACKKANVRLIHVWEHEWLHKPHVIQSIIKSAAGIYDEVRRANALELKEPPREEFVAFMNDNHLQGSDRYTKAVGLYDDGRLVQAMSIVNRGGGQWEVNRVCSKLGYLVAGGRRLLEELAKGIGDEIVAYPDVATQSLGEYYHMGFELVDITKPSYFYHDGNGNVLSKHQCQKGKLVQMGYGSSMTEKEIMEQRGYVRVYDCGSYKLRMSV